MNSRFDAVAFEIVEGMDDKRPVLAAKAQVSQRVSGVIATSRADAWAAML